MKTDYEVGDKIRLKAPVWDSRLSFELLGKSGGVFVVKSISPPNYSNYPIYVSPENAHVKDVSFGVRFKEVEPVET